MRKANKAALANRRVPTTDKAIFAVTSTINGLRLNGNAVDLMNINYEDVKSDEGVFVDLYSFKLEDGSKVHGLAVTDGKSGAKLGNQGKKSTTLLFSAAAIYKELDGVASQPDDEETTTIEYEVTEAAVDFDNTTNEATTVSAALEAGDIKEDGNGGYVWSDDENEPVEVYYYIHSPKNVYKPKVDQNKGEGSTAKAPKTSPKKLEVAGDQDIV